MATTKRPDGTVLLLDPVDRQGHAGGRSTLDDGAVARVADVLRDVWPDHALLVSRWSADAIEPAVTGEHGVAAATISTSRYFADARRLRELPLQPYERVAVVRPGVVLLPAPVLRAAVERATARACDLAVVAGIPPDVFHVVSARALALIGSVGGVPGCVTIPQAVERLAAAGATFDEAPLTVVRLAPRDVGWTDAASAAALPRHAWTSPDVRALSSLPSAARVAEVLRLEHDAFAAARSALRQRRPIVVPAARRARASVLVVVPSPYQSGAHAAWAELAGHLSPAQVAFVAGQSTALARVLRDRGFEVIGVADGLAPGSAPDAAALLAALDDLQPGVVHVDGAECNAWVPAIAARGVRLVQHVRLNDVDRFRPGFTCADAVVGVSPHVCAEIVARVGPSLRVEHIADGVCLEARTRRPGPARAAPGDGDIRCLCVGRVEPAKGQLRVLDVFRALRERLGCSLVIVGPCGSDPAYGDAVNDRVLAEPPGVVAWRPFTYPVTDLYQQAHVVLVGSRNEALGMVGLEALAAGALLVAQRSTGYASIIDEANAEGLLYDADEPAAAVAARIVAALTDYETYSASARRKVAACFSASDTARRLTRLWREVAASE